MAKKYSPYKMKGHTLPGIQQSPAKMAGKMDFGRPDEFDARGIEGNRANAEREFSDQTLATKNRRQQTAHRDPKTGDWKA